MSQAYAQLISDDKSQMLTVITISKGLFKYNRLCFGVPARVYQLQNHNF